MLDRPLAAVRTLPHWFTLLGGRMYEKCAVTMTLGILPEATHG
jgi:hypothetical protein